MSEAQHRFEVGCGAPGCLPRAYPGAGAAQIDRSASGPQHGLPETVVSTTSAMLEQERR
jgi:hypothetical protein